jgi:hypothetical protein
MITSDCHGDLGVEPAPREDCTLPGPLSHRKSSSPNSSPSLLSRFTCSDPTAALVFRYFIIFEGDWLAAAAMGYTPESTSATYPCAECMWVSKAARKRGRDGDGHAPLRTHADLAFLAATAARLTAARLSKAALEEQMAAAGMNALTCVLQPDRIPGADSVRDKPGDIMHIYGAGIIRPEAALALRFSSILARVWRSITHGRS